MDCGEGGNGPSSACWDITVGWVEVRKRGELSGEFQDRAQLTPLDGPWGAAVRCDRLCAGAATVRRGPLPDGTAQLHGDSGRQEWRGKTKRRGRYPGSDQGVHGNRHFRSLRRAPAAGQLRHAGPGRQPLDGVSAGGQREERQSAIPGGMVNAMSDQPGPPGGEPIPSSDKLAAARFEFDKQVEERQSRLEERKLRQARFDSWSRVIGTVVVGLLITGASSGIASGVTPRPDTAPSWPRRHRR